MDKLNTVRLSTLLRLPYRPWDVPTDYDSLILAPAKELHDSGYRNFVVIGVRNGVAVEKITEASDHLQFTFLTERLNMDCLKNSKAIRLWESKKVFHVSPALSSLYITVKERVD